MARINLHAQLHATGHGFRSLQLLFALVEAGHDIALQCSATEIVPPSRRDVLVQCLRAPFADGWDLALDLDGAIGRTMRNAVAYAISPTLGGCPHLAQIAAFGFREVWVNTEVQVDLLEDQGLDLPIRVVPDGQVHLHAPNPFHSGNPGPGDPIRIYSPGSYSDLHGHDLALSAFASVAQRRPVILYCHWRQTELELAFCFLHKVHKHGGDLPAQIKRIPFLPTLRDVGNLLGGMDIVLSPDRQVSHRQASWNAATLSHLHHVISRWPAHEQLLYACGDRDQRVFPIDMEWRDGRGEPLEGAVAIALEAAVDRVLACRRLGAQLEPPVRGRTWAEIVESLSDALERS